MIFDWDDGQTFALPSLYWSLVCVSVSHCERRGAAADEPSEVWHDRGHGHADSPERGLGPLQPEETLQHVDDLCQYLLHSPSARHLYGNKMLTVLFLCLCVCVFVCVCISTSDLFGSVLCDSQSLQVAAGVLARSGQCLQRQASYRSTSPHLRHSWQRLHRPAAEWVACLTSNQTWSDWGWIAISATRLLIKVWNCLKKWINKPTKWVIRTAVLMTFKWHTSPSCSIDRENQSMLIT